MRLHAKPMMAILHGSKTSASHGLRYVTLLIWIRWNTLYPALLKVCSQTYQSNLAIFSPISTVLQHTLIPAKCSSRLIYSAKLKNTIASSMNLISDYGYGLPLCTGHWAARAGNI